MSEVPTFPRIAWSGSARDGLAELGPEATRAVALFLDRYRYERPVLGSDNELLTVLHPAGEAIAVTLHFDGARGLLRVRDVDPLPFFIPQAEPMVQSPSPAAQTLADLAARLAGPNRTYLRDEWDAVLRGTVEGCASPSRVRQALLVLGFLTAAGRLRVRDLCRPAWRPVDWLLRVPSRTNTFISAVVGAQAVYIVGSGGLASLVVEVWEPCGIAGASMFVLARWLRRVRGFELAVQDSERNDE
jgi:hypothetical protein